MNKIDLSIIILSFNTREMTSDCLKLIISQIKNSVFESELIIFDNGSSDGSAEMLEAFENHNSDIKIHIYQSKKNLGFAQANNLASKKAQGKYLLFLNSDTLCGKGVIDGMMRFLNNRPGLALASCQLRNQDGSIQPQGGWLPRLSTVFIWAMFLDDIPFLRQILPSYQLRKTSFFTGRPKEIGWIAGTAMWIRAEIWQKLNGFDESLFMYGEDVELCCRARSLGFKVMINPNFYITHLGRGSSQSANWITGEVQGLLHIFKIHKPGWELPLLRLILRCGMIARWFIFGILKHDEDFGQGYASALKSI